jgi:TetR/AcrR family transcriptional repressor of nem operon
MKPHANRELLLDIAEELIRSRGYNAFSYHDLAHRAGIKTASIHYHFPTKADLAVAVAQRYRLRFAAMLDALAQSKRSRKRVIRDFFGLFDAPKAPDQRICLCGVLAADLLTLPPPVQHEVRKFFQLCESWLATRLKAAHAHGDIHFPTRPLPAAKSIVAGLEGALLAARTFDDASRTRAHTQWLLGMLFSKPD